MNDTLTDAEWVKWADNWFKRIGSEEMTQLRVHTLYDHSKRAVPPSVFQAMMAERDGLLTENKHQVEEIERLKLLLTEGVRFTQECNKLLHLQSLRKWIGETSDALKIEPEVNSKREQLIADLHLDIEDTLANLYEKLFCASLLRQGTVVTSEVLKEYLHMKEVLAGSAE